MKKIALLTLLALTGCSYVPEKVDVTYHPTVKSEPITAASQIKIDVQVTDSRRDGKRVSCKKGDHGVELASIRLKSDLTKEIVRAMQLELKERGFSLGLGDTNVEIDIQKFYNDFKKEFWGGRGVSELILSVNVKKKDGNFVYSKTIIGMGENDSVWRHSGKNAKIALEAALSDAISKLVNDKAFLQALTKKAH